MEKDPFASLGFVPESKDQFSDLGFQPSSNFNTPPPIDISSKPGYLSRVGTELKSAYSGLQKTTERGAELMNEGRTGNLATDLSKNVQGAVMSGLGAAESAIQAAFSPVTAALSPLFESGLKASGVLDNEKVRKTLVGLDTWAKAHPDAAENLKNLVTVGTTVYGAKGAKKVAPIIKEEAKAVVDYGVKTAKAGVEAVTPAIKGTVGVAKSTVGGVVRTPARIATNIAEKQAVEKTIKSLPTKIAQRAARDGIDPLDVKTLYKVSKEVKPSARKLADNVIKFAKKETNVDPIEMVGKPVVMRMKALESAGTNIGKKLGDVSTKLGAVKSSEIAPPVFNSLKKVRGLEGLTVNSKGVLNFKNTVLTTAETSSDRKAIQSIFTQAIKSGSGQQKHLLRQELFEVLGGKKRALTALTDTQEKSYQAIRSGLSTVLESKDATYKSLSNQYRTVIYPLTEMRKMMKTIPGATEDILDMQAGLLARRLTSTSLSQGKVKMILKAMDDVAKVKGSTLKTTEELQNLYNLLGKYYDLAPKTGFQGQVKAGVEGATGLTDLITGAIRSVAGETSAVRQKALENALMEALK